MCAIFGFLSTAPVRDAHARANLRRGVARLQHRGPDGQGIWLAADACVGMSHARLSVIDLETGAQPMASPNGNVIVYNGEIYNYLELRDELERGSFSTASDTEVILRAYERWGTACVSKLRGMFAFALWDANRRRLFMARDRFGIKPLYYLVSGTSFLFASEIKALTEHLSRISTNLAALQEYVTFQFCLGEKTMFEGVRQLEPAHFGEVSIEGDRVTVTTRKYWEIEYKIDWHHTENYFISEVRERLAESLRMHLRSDVEVGAYLSGGLDSSVIVSAARSECPMNRFQAFTGKFSAQDAFDESSFARSLSSKAGVTLHEIDISENDFIDNISKVIYHLDEPVAGPGSFAQYMVSKLASKYVKVLLAGQGGDEIFGGYARYLLAYWEQCIKGALDGTVNSGNFIVTYASIIPNLQTLQEYKALIQEFWSEGFFEPRDKRYFRLVNRSNTLGDIIDFNALGKSSPLEEFRSIFWGPNVQKESYFDSMTHFDFKTLLPALLHVEDRMSTAHGIESRVPFLDHRLVELVATIPSSIKFKNGELKRLLRIAFKDLLPQEILQRKDKMGFPVPLQPWIRSGGKVREFVLDLFRSSSARQRFYLAPEFDIERLLQREGRFGRNLWALLSLELWQQQFHDRYPQREET